MVAGTDETPIDMSFWHDAYALHGAEVFGFLLRKVGRREEAEDLLQETFVRAIRAGSFRRGGHLRGYLFQTARHLLVNRLRRAGRGVAEPRREGGDGFEEIASAEASPEQTVGWRRFGERLRERLETLSKAHRKAFQMAVLEGRSYEEVARICGWTTGQVKTNVYRARRRLIDDLGEHLTGLVGEVGDPASGRNA